MARNTKKKQNNFRKQINSGKYDWMQLDEYDDVFVKGNEKRFSINWFGAVIHGCAIRTSNNGNDFISFPAFKGKDGKYIKTAYIYAEKESENEDILECIIETITGKS
ncbi:MAG: hypothetical protein KBS70_05745 [Bacteroidales bacterium]|nr:hypothetical protein [Candidatus Colicola equi]